MAFELKAVDLSPGKRRRITLVLYGSYKTGKTQFAATFPRPLFLSDKGESGWETIRYMSPELFYEPERKTQSNMPVEVFPIAKAEEMNAFLPMVREAITKDPTKYGTIVIDSFTFYSDTYQAALEWKYRQEMGAKYDPRKMFQDLGSHLRNIMIAVHDMTEPFGINVVWICLEKPPGDDSPGGLLLAGQAANKTPARCDGVLYHKFYSAGKDLVYEVHSRPYGTFMAGGRGFQALPSPLVSATYRDLEQHLGIIPRYGKAVKAA